ncbi:MAG: chorismate synthase [Granulosicoccus sp.]
MHLTKKVINVAGNSFGQLFKITTFGESHGKAIGVIIDGCPAGLEIDEAFIQSELARRRPGQSAIVTQRKEGDEVQILSGIFAGKSTGTPISMVIYNQDQRSKDYSHIADKFRPSHADFTYQKKYGTRDYRGGGRSSARETAARVAAGAIAKLFLKKHGISVTGYVSQVGDIAVSRDYQNLDFSKTEETAVRCPDLETAERMIDLIKKIKKQGDTIGGVVSAVVQGCPVGLGEPVFDKLHADLGKAMLSINACKGFEYGSGFDSVTMRGSEHNDIFETKNGATSTKSNFSGGVQGGISNGMDIYFRVAFKPVATIIRKQDSINEAGEDVIVEGKGRHDPCVVPRAVPIVEAMAALVVADFWLRNASAKV